MTITVQDLPPEHRNLLRVIAETKHGRIEGITIVNGIATRVERVRENIDLRKDFEK